MNYYEILNLKPNSTKNEIKKAYHKLAIKYHPDKSNNSENEELFKKISEAYSVLSDENKKRQYDSTGITDIDMTNPLEMFHNIFNNFKADNNFNSDNFEVNLYGSCDFSQGMFNPNNLMNSEKMNNILPDMFNTFTSVITGNENNDDNPMKTNLVKTFMNVTKNIINNHNNSDYNTTVKNNHLDNNHSDNNHSDNTTAKNNHLDNNHLDNNHSDNTTAKNNHLDNNHSDNTMAKNNHLDNNHLDNNHSDNKPKEIFISKEFSLKDFYNNKKKKFNYYRLENNEKIKDSIIINLVLNEKLIVENKGHNIKNYKEKGDVIFFFTLKDEILEYKVEKLNIIIEQNISLSDLYSSYKLDLILPNDKNYNLEINDLYKNYSNYLIPNMGLLDKEDNKGDLIIKFNIIFNELSSENILLLNKIFPKHIS